MFQKLYQKGPTLQHSWPATITAVCVISFILLAVTVASILLGAEDEVIATILITMALSLRRMAA